MGHQGTSASIPGPHPEFHCAGLPLQAHALHEAEARASVAEEAARAAALDAACLRRGLELAAEQLTRSAGAEVPGTLLKAVARVRGLAGGEGAGACHVPGAGSQLPGVASSSCASVRHIVVAACSVAERRARRRRWSCRCSCRMPGSTWRSCRRRWSKHGRTCRRSRQR